ncbi:hypothetical protein L195_g010462, partial [Trifolium pratense]
MGSCQSHYGLGQFAYGGADPRGDSSVRSSENKDFIPVGIGMEAKISHGHFGAGIGNEASVFPESVHIYY